MKNINKNIRTASDPIAEARKNKNFLLYSKTARVTVRLAAEVYEKRKQREWTQIRLAKEIGTTQKVVSNIEGADVEIGIGLLKRLVDGLTLTTDDLGSIFESGTVLLNFNSTAATKNWSKDSVVSGYANKSANSIK